MPAAGPEALLRRAAGVRRRNRVLAAAAAATLIAGTAAVSTAQHGGRAAGSRGISVGSDRPGGQPGYSRVGVGSLRASPVGHRHQARITGVPPGTRRQLG